MLEINGHGATVVHEFSQGSQFGYMELDPKTRGGVCASISAHWLRCQASGQDFWSWIKTVKGIASVINSQATGELNLDRGSAKVPGGMAHETSGDPNAWIVRCVGPSGMFLVSKEESTRLAMQAADWILHKTGQYKFIGLYGDAGGHAVAASNVNGFTFMDPNVGEVRFPAPGNFMAWFPKFLSSYKFQDSPTSPVKTFSSFGVMSLGVTRGRR